MVDISPTASEELSKVLQEDRFQGKCLAVSFMGYGWSGPVLGLALEEPDDDFKQFEAGGLSIIMHSTLAEYLEPLGGVIIDYVDHGPHERGFTVTTRSKGKSDCGGGCSSSACGEKQTE